MKLSVVTPIYNDAYLAKDFVEELSRITFKEVELFEIIFVDDGSSINDLSLKNLADNYPFVKVLYLSRNFGQHIALSAAYQASSGDLTCMINVDQQDPPKEIQKLISYLLNNELDIVYGLRKKRKESLFKNISSKGFNLLLNKLTGDNTPLNVATVRVMNRNFLEAYNGLTEKSRYIPGLESWLGFEKGYVPIDQQSRIDTKSSYNFNKRLKMALSSVVSFSDLPLKWSALGGMVLSAVGFLILIILTIMKLFYIDFQPGYVSTVALVIFIGGIQIFVVGLASIYIGRILKEVQNRPLYLIKKKLNV